MAAIEELKIYQPAAADTKIKLLVYGDPGVGKTTFAASSAAEKELSPVLFLNVEGGMLSVVDYKPDTVDIKSMDDLARAFRYLTSSANKYKTVIIDSLSELAQLGLDSVVGKALGKNGGSGSKREGMDDAFLEDYGKNTHQIARIIRAFRDLPMHVILTCLSASTMDDAKRETVYPALTPKLRSQIPAYVDIVGYLFVAQDNEGKSTRRMLFQPYGKFMAKDRSPGGRLGMVMDNPTMPRVYAAITKTAPKSAPKEIAK